MKVITIPSEEKTLNELFEKAQHAGLVLQSAGGQRFVLASLEEDWEGFDVGGGDDFEQETKLTVQNKELMKFLSQRRSQGKKIPLAEVKKELGLE
jgi:hypothetical protein